MGIHLTRIYTRQGDQGDTRLGDMTLVRKDHLRVIAYGEVDELNAVLGVVRLCDLPEGWDARLGSVQNDLFDVGADLAGSDDEGAHEVSWLSRTRAVLSVVSTVRLARRDVKSTARVVDIALSTT